MPCVTATGELTPSGRSILEALAHPRDAQALAEATGLPLFRARASLREFVEAGLVEEREGTYEATDRGRKLLGA